MVKKYSNLKIMGIQCAKSMTEGGADCSDLAVLSSQKLMQRLQVMPEEIGTMIYVTQSPRYMTPSTSFYIHKKLNIGIDCFQYDINQGATGCLTGIQLVSSLMSGFQEKKKGLLLLGDNSLLTDGVLWNQAAAVLLQEQANESIYVSNYSEGAAYPMYLLEKHQKQPQISEEFFQTGNERMQSEMEKMRCYAQSEQIQIENCLECASLTDSAVRLYFHLNELKMEGNVMVGTMGAGLSVASAILQLDKKIYGNIINE